MQRMLAEEVPPDKPVWAYITTPVVDWRLTHDSAFLFDCLLRFLVIRYAP